MTCRQCWKLPYCKVGQDNFEPCYLFEREKLPGVLPDNEQPDQEKDDK